MTKTQEIETIKTFTMSLPQDSYLRPWLEEVMPQIEADIRNDFPVHVMTISQMNRHCAQIENDAKQRMAEMLEKARKDADRLVEAGKLRAQQTVDRALHYAREAVNKLEVAA